MKAAFAAAVGGLQSLGHDDVRERPVDRIAALGAAQIKRADEARGTSVLISLGVDLIRFKHANCARAQKDAADKLASVLDWRKLEDQTKSAWGIKTTGRQRDRIAAQAIIEWAIDFCPVCTGKGEVPDHDLPQTGAQPMKCCPTDVGCGGTGKRRYTDAERIEAMGEAFSRAMATAHGIIGRAEALAVSMGKEMLERWD